MNLDYSILWFDDSAEYLDSLDMAPLTEKIESWGLRPLITPVSTAAEFEKHRPYDQFDLIAIDFNLETEGCGKDFIAQVRDQRVYTEVIFYSADESDALWESLVEKRLEGVFIANRSNVLAKIELVAHQSLKKILDTENMRGIVMAEVGDIDHTLESILRSGIPSIEEEDRARLFQKFHKDIAKSADGRVVLIEEFAAGPTVEQMLSLCDSSKRWENFTRLAKVHPAFSGLKIGDYQTDVLKPRNFLAHGRATVNANGVQVFAHGGTSYDFSDQIGAELRVTIGKYRDQFLSLKAKFP